MAKYYAVKSGRITGIYTSWEECKVQVSGFSGAEYKAFTTKTAAKEYLGLIELKEKKKDNIPEPNTKKGTVIDDCPETTSDAVAYVDGSYNIRTNEFAFGAVLFWKNEMYTFSHKYDDAELASMRNVAGEIKGSEFIIKYCVQNSIKSVDMYYDYEGIASWALGKWKTNKEGTKAYKKLYDELSKKVIICFKKVKGHSNDKYNDMADRLAKEVVGNP